jgi:hypothetical protein
VKWSYGKASYGEAIYGEVEVSYCEVLGDKGAMYYIRVILF